MCGPGLHLGVMNDEVLGQLGKALAGRYSISREAPIVLVLEPRIRAAVLLVAGLKFQSMQPEVDPLSGTGSTGSTGTWES